VLERLTDTFIAGVELLEAEGRVARDQLVALTGALLVLIGCGVVAPAGLLAAAVGLTWLLARAIGVGGALAIAGTLLLAGSVIVARFAIDRLRRRTGARSAGPVPPSPACPAPPPPQAGDAHAATPWHSTNHADTFGASE
jgi:hypothetical protein